MSRVFAHYPHKLFKSLSVLGDYLLQYVGIRGVFDKNPQKGGIAFSPGGHTDYNMV
jgi:hypothetical protein